MKHIYIFLIVASFLSSSCNKVLDTVPTGNLTPELSYQSVPQITAALSGIYTNLKYSIGYAQYYTAYYTAPTDESYFYNTGIPYAIYNNNNADNTTGNTIGFWKACYQSINYANTLIDNIDASAAGKVDSNIVRRAKGEALFLRGFHYFLLAQWYGDIPLQIHATTDPTQGQIARTPVKQVYDQIIADMTLADSLMYDQTFASLGYSEKVSRTAVEGMLARVCLYAAGQPVNDTKRYADAIVWAQKVINSGQHSLLSSYSQVFIDECKNNYNSENIWEIGFSQKGTGVTSAGGGIGVYVGVPQTVSNGTSSTGTTLYDSGYCYGYLKLHPRLYSSYQSGDYRRNWNVANYTFSSAVKVPLASNKYWSRSPAKWRREYEPAASRSVQMTSCTNFPVLRYADVLLMLAEAENEVNGATATAYNAINQVRQRSISPSRIIDSIGFTIGTGYTSQPAVTVTNSTGTGWSITMYYSASAKTVQPLLTNQGSGLTSPLIITIGTLWTANTAYTVGTQVAAANGLLYTVTTTGTTKTIAPTNISGASPAATTGAVFTYAGVAATATVYLTGVPQVNLTAGLSKDQFRQAVQNERYWELAFEALRLPDLKRWGILISTVQGLTQDINGTNPTYPQIPSIISEMGAGTDATPLSPTMNISQKDIFWPIPLYELSLNKLLTQNPGY